MNSLKSVIAATFSALFYVKGYSTIHEIHGRNKLVVIVVSSATICIIALSLLGICWVFFPDLRESLIPKKDTVIKFGITVGICYFCADYLYLVANAFDVGSPLTTAVLAIMTIIGGMAFHYWKERAPLNLYDFITLLLALATVASSVKADTLRQPTVHTVQKQ